MVEKMLAKERKERETANCLAVHQRKKDRSDWKWHDWCERSVSALNRSDWVVQADGDIEGRNKMHEEKWAVANKWGEKGGCEHLESSARFTFNTVSAATWMEILPSHTLKQAHCWTTRAHKVFFFLQFSLTAADKTPTFWFFPCIHICQTKWVTQAETGTALTENSSKKKGKSTNQKHPVTRYCAITSWFESILTPRSSSQTLMRKVCSVPPFLLTANWNSHHSRYNLQRHQWLEYSLIFKNARGCHILHSGL